MKDYSDMSDEEVLEKIREADEKVDGNLTISDFNEIADVSVSFVRSRFGSWNEAKDL